MKTDKLVNNTAYKLFQIKIIVILFIPLIVISTVLIVIRYYNEKKDLIEDFEIIETQIEDSITYSVKIFDESYSVVENLLSDPIENIFIQFASEYEKSDRNPEKMDLEKLRKEEDNEIDLYIIENGVVKYSTFDPDIGLDFKIWPKFYKKLEIIQKGNRLIHDRISVSKKTNKIRLWSYMPSVDNKYIFEIAIISEKIEEIIQDIDVMKIIEYYENSSPIISTVRIFNVFGREINKDLSEKSNISHVLDIIKSEGDFSIANEHEHKLVKYFYIDLEQDNLKPYNPSKIIELTYDMSNINKNLYSVVYRSLFSAAVSLLFIFVFVFFISKKIKNEFDYVNKELLNANFLLGKLSSLDGLTGIANRRIFDEVLDNEWSRARRNGKMLGLMMIDVDFFKKYNDFYGHQKGDDCLVKIVDEIKKFCRRPADLAARYGGEEFVIIMPDTDKTDALAIADNIIRAIRDLKIENKDSNLNFVTVSIGVAALIPKTDLNNKSIIEIADKALYKAKNQGKNQAVLNDIGSL